MPTITIHITVDVPDDDPTNGGDFAADLTAYVFTHYRLPTIRIDRDNDQPVATRLPQRVWDSTNESDWDQMLARQANYRYQVDEMEYDRVTSMDCPFCGAVAGKPCVRASGAAYKRPTTHSDRKRAYAAHEAATRTATKVARQRVRDEDLAHWPEQDRDSILAPVVLDEVFAEYCQCGHGEVVHYANFDDSLWPCVIDGCSCDNYVALVADQAEGPVM